MKLRLVSILFFTLAIPNILIANYCCKSRVELAGWWGSGDYLLIWRKKRNYPPLVTTSPVGTAAADAGVLGLSTTSILFGGDVGSSPKSGWAFDVGIWLNRCWGFGGGFFNPGKETNSFSDRSNAAGVPILARPFFDVATGTQSSILISFPATTSGNVDIDATNNIWSYDLYARYQVLKVKNLQLDLLGGMLFTTLDDDLNVNTFSQDLGTGDTTTRWDRFNAANDHYAGMIGAELEWDSCWWSLQAIVKVALGNMVKRVEIDGETISVAGGVATFTNGGLLALPTNIGHHTSNDFEVVSMFQANGCLSITRNLFLKVGYSLVYWPNIALAAEQIDLDINPTQLNGGALVGTPAPLFALNQKSFWIHGLQAGFYFSF